MFRRPARKAKEGDEEVRKTILPKLMGAASQPTGHTRKVHTRVDQADDQHFPMKTNFGLKEPKSKADKKPKDKSRGPADARPKNERPMKESRVRNITEYYLGQREASAGMVRDMLHRRAYSWLRTLAGEDRATAEAEFTQWVETVIAENVASGFINDKRYAEMKARSWRDSGRASRRIAMDLTKKGISEDIIRDAIQAIDAETITADIDPDVVGEESDRAAAETLAQKKRIGQYRTGPKIEDAAQRAKIWRREAGVLARAGYGLDIIRDILDREPEIEDY